MFSSYIVSTASPQLFSDQIHLKRRTSSSTFSSVRVFESQTLLCKQMKIFMSFVSRVSELSNRQESKRNSGICVYVLHQRFTHTIEMFDETNSLPPSSINPRSSSLSLSLSLSPLPSLSLSSNSILSRSLLLSREEDVDDWNRLVDFHISNHTHSPRRKEEDIVTFRYTYVYSQRFFGYTYVRVRCI